MRTLLLLLPAVLLASTASAQSRSFTRSRDWYLPHEGEVEVEWRSFVNTRDGRHLGQLDFAYGIGPSAAVEAGIEFEQREEQESDVESVDLELRLRFGEHAYDRWLPALSLEYEHPNEDDDTLEARVIFSRYQLDGKDATLNLVLERELEGGRENEVALTGGFLVPLREGDGSATWYGVPRVGLEAVWGIDDRSAEVGPLLAYRVSEHVSLLVSYTFSVHDRDENPDTFAFLAELEL